MIGPGKPEIIEQPKAKPVYFAGDWMYLTCEVRCGEKVKFTCFVNNEELRGMYYILRIYRIFPLSFHYFLSLHTIV